MDCPICNEPTRAIRTLSVGTAGSSTERRCPNGHRWTYATLLVGEIKKRGDGAHAVATKIENGVNPLPQSDQ